MELKCANCGNGKWRDGVTSVTSVCTTCHYVDKGALVPQPSKWKPKEQTNADRIRAMSDEELAEFLSDDERACPPKWHNCRKHISDCGGCWLEWLKQPAEE